MSFSEILEEIPKLTLVERRELFLQVLSLEPEEEDLAISVGRFRGIAKGLWDIPFACWKYRSARKTVKAETIQLARKLRSVA